MKTAAEEIYSAIGEGYGFNGTKEAAIEIIDGIINKHTPRVVISECRCAAPKVDMKGPLIYSPDKQTATYNCQYCNGRFTMPILSASAQTGT